ncbi:Glyoxylase, beta-lactamase superfamily II [Desulfuromusa kysingii]|uniref:Glyoxylase, beta-lactamase superfamily II n=1 Tax=Desulfuromusa kysingii TaxID=37625 RepID=A0A1H3W725_9BACT|nr:MBL fold metallo-hydrolase [Desulfuromusa kysingii]SDZ82905.1 Glyoxylase, beta-lactamase superfamily II [Desulfuromusa kysingii]
MKIIDSVAGVFCHQDFVFAVRRQSHLQAFPGYESFPGGKIDREDSPQQHPSPFLCDFDGQSIHALVREIAEELGYDLVAAISAGEVTAVKFLATALAPATAPVRFRVHFFRIDLQSRPLFELDAGEIAAGFWNRPEQLLARFRRGDALMVPPFRWVLERLQRNPADYNLGNLSPQTDETLFVPRFELLSGLMTLSVPSNTFPPEKRTNAFLLGDPQAPQVLVDPSPEAPQVFERLVRTLEADDLAAIFLTHHHHDHHEFAPELAKHLNIPIWLSADTLDRILQKQGKDYFSAVTVEVRQAGDCLTTWKGESVRVYSVPGHDAGQLALAPDSLRWFLVGDLIQSFGTVLISAPEGDMTDYYQTLKQIIALDPAVIIPSHGMPMRSTFRLHSTLQHRMKRENKILTMHASGKTPVEMLNSIYQGVDQRLFPFALETIKSHLRKLQQEGKI